MLFFSFFNYDDAILQCGSELVGALWVTEMSSPFLHLRELLKEMGYRDTAFNLAADVSLLSWTNFASVCKLQH